METLSSYMFTNLKRVKDPDIIAHLNPVLMPNETVIGVYQNTAQCREALARYVTFTTLRVIIDDAYSQDATVLMRTYFPYNQIISVRTMHKLEKDGSKKDLYAICLYFQWGKVQSNFDTTECLRVSEIQQAVDAVLLRDIEADRNDPVLCAMSVSLP